MTVITEDSAFAILEHLLGILRDASNRHHRRYQAVLKNLLVDHELFTYLRPQVYEMFGHGKIPNWDQLKQFGGDINAEDRGVYLHIIRGTDGKDRLYVGQSTNMAVRIKKNHLNFRYRRDHKSFHYFAVEDSTWDTFVILATIPSPLKALSHGHDNASVALLLNVLEMWCALMLRTLQPAQAEQYLPPGEAVEESTWFPLNVASPIDHGDSTVQRMWSDTLIDSRDKLAVFYHISHVSSKYEDRYGANTGCFQEQSYRGTFLAGIIVGLSFGYFLATKFDRRYR
ncbi:hypothetical protein M501DRAFT_413611 [Patellaria atrata CBS 101060]|uniref:GIY-YIG domain-containing protein n=1 Tax=Patellaria atrata CBS 101060 TaxID=1346257 RepID=A0A9P4VUW2_9PEZI|nr:hypothetical protein M501DRAFT_413611 [Patellaria atrata CBS 101060]